MSPNVSPAPAITDAGAPEKKAPTRISISVDADIYRQVEALAKKEDRQIGKETDRLLKHALEAGVA